MSANKLMAEGAFESVVGGNELRSKGLVGVWRIRLRVIFRADESVTSHTTQATPTWLCGFVAACFIVSLFG